MKKQSRFTELLDSLLGAGTAQAGGEEKLPEESAPEQAHGGEKDALAELGAAFIARLKLPEGMSRGEAAESIIARWKKADEEGGPAEKESAGSAAAEKEARAAGEDAGEADYRRLPRILRGGIGSMPEADYESMSAEQFRRLKKQLERARRDGRRIRL